ncbi:lipopolysaccharide biosynthesis protein [Sphingomonas koreensis]|uniref:Polysaccharide biosynthesis protein n=1 Tax=Sphingomonas koreensis TaxID=93064 RepID=A0A1L6J6X0_9SPHN|nr:lipopolysaccharide biosynthesis protein [Sphingomonas koreensis]APR51692.1 polysaccharide biosynthesis protein [Sphingomonas koreensis]MDC7811860.1 lipopolysaccharide biosynthesis protein [Sphingomonas koreensis]PJI88941.1 O-antigen/teichoic acid export membrane protein [Sphingomonas koreensis]RSU21307.1 lipopolysaccharide biosynthesis protein [Sphingomonas koreensis]RSU23701.1 lipopolysaccharide biosynthesis protein [Sphingomonas koreensis]
MTSDARPAPSSAPSDDIAALAKGGRTNIFGFVLRLAARLPFLFIAGRLYGPEIVGRFALAVVVVELAALLATLGLKRGLAQALASTERPHAHVVWDGMVVAFVVSMIASAVLFTFPQIMYANSQVTGLEGLLPVIVFAIAWSDVSLAALAYRGNVKAAVTARAIVEPWTISIAAWALYYASPRDGLIIAYVLSMAAALIASLIPFIRSYGLPHGWSPHVTPLLQLARRNVPLAGADAIEWGTRNIDRFILGLLFPPAIVGIYYMAQQVASIPQKLKTSFDPILGPVIARNLAAGNRVAIAHQVKQVAFWIITAQAALLLMGGIPAEGVMGVVGPQFVAGAGALCFLLAAEMFASPGAVAEAGLVYMARHRNLMVSMLLLGFQAALSFALVFIMRDLGWDVNYQAAGPAVALAVTLAAGSTIKCWMLSRLTKASVFSLRPGFVAAVAVAGVVGWAFTQLPPRLEWVELSVGVPAIFAAYFAVIGKWAFGEEDRKLFKKLPKEGSGA